MKDSNGKTSKTLMFVTVAFAAVVAAFIYSQTGNNPFGLQEFGTSVMTILAPWLGREWKEAHYSD